ncbi:hypothetical protein KUCAC02_020402, partial [Chaenocephalus aceratus]
AASDNRPALVVLITSAFGSQETNKYGPQPSGSELSLSDCRQRLAARLEEMLQSLNPHLFIRNWTR